MSISAASIRFGRASSEQRPRTAFRGSLLAAAVVAAGAVSVPARELPDLDPEQGEILGKAAIAFVALDKSGERPLSQEGLEVHLSPLASPTEELTFPCGEWILPPAGEYRFWIEGEGRISPSHGIFGYSAPPFEGRGSISARPTMLAGTVALGAETSLSEDEELRLLHVDSHNQGESPQPEMSRRVRGSRISEGVLMPSGPVVAGVFSRTADGYRTIARPVEVVPGRTVRPQMGAPADGSDVIAILDRPKVATTFEEYDTDPFLALADASERAPDVLIPTAERLFAIWYGVVGRVATLRVRSPSLHLPPREIPLRVGKVETYRGALAPLPSLEVTVTLPEGFPLADDAAVEVLREATGESVISLNLVAAGTVTVPAVPAEPLKVVLSLPPFRQSEAVDLSDGTDGEVTFHFKAYLVTGVVYRGDEPHPADLEFGFWSGPRYRKTIPTDDEGRYQAVFLRPPYAVAIRLRERPDAPYSEVLANETFEEVTHLDFHVPGNSFVVHVVDARTGGGIGNSVVGVVNMWGKTTEDEEGFSTAMSLDTNMEGRTEVPPLRPGEVWLTAEAAGYRPRDHLKFVLGSDDPGREMTIELEPAGSTERVQALLPTGVPAAGAEAIVVAALDQDGAAPVWRGTADASGWFEVPDGIGEGWMILRHPSAAFLAGRWTPATTGEPWRLPAAAAPLSLHVVRSWGDPAPWGRLALGLDGITLAGTSLQWAAGSGAADGTGFWRSNGLPAGPIEVVAWVAGDGTPRDPAALLASFATRISYPWNGPIEIEAIE